MLSDVKKKKHSEGQGSNCGREKVAILYIVVREPVWEGDTGVEAGRAVWRSVGRRSRYEQKPQVKNEWRTSLACERNHRGACVPKLKGVEGEKSSRQDQRAGRGDCVDHLAHNMKFLFHAKCDGMPWEPKERPNLFFLLKISLWLLWGIQTLEGKNGKTGRAVRKILEFVRQNS